jgi:hypothetical protein
VRTRTRRTLTAAAIALAATIPAAGARASAQTNLAAAQTASTALVAGVALPAGAVSSPVEPAGDGSVLANPPSVPATPNLVDAHAWWIVPGAPAAVIAYVRAHPPHGSTCAPSFMPTATSVTDECSVPDVPGVLTEGTLLVLATPLPGGATGLRVDAQEVWLVPRSPSERIPPGARRLVVTVTRPGRPRSRPVTVTAIHRIDRVAALLDALPLAQPGVTSCPLDLAARIRLAFYARGARAPLALAAVDPGGCGEVRLAIRGRSQPTLTSRGLTALAGRIGAVLGLRLP